MSNRSTDNLDLPKDVQERIERRWAQKVQQQAMISRDSRTNMGSVAADGGPVTRGGKRVRRSQPQAA